MRVRSLGQDLLEDEMVTHSSILAWKIPWAEEPGGQSVGVTEFTTESTRTHVCLLRLHNFHCLPFQLLRLMNISGWVSRTGCKREDDSYLPLVSQKRFPA